MTEVEFDDLGTVPHRFADLWRTVLICAVQDAIVGVQMSGTKADKIKATHVARAYVRDYNRDFNHVCSLAGLDPEAVRERVVPQINAAPTPEQIFAGRKAMTQLPLAKRKRQRKGREKASVIPSIAPGQYRSFDALESPGDGTQEDEHQSDRNEIRNKHLYHEKSSLPERVDKRRHGKHHQHVSDETETVAEHTDSSGLCLITVGTDRLTQPYNAPGVGQNLPASKGTGAGSTAQESVQIDFHDKAITE